MDDDEKPKKIHKDKQLQQSIIPVTIDNNTKLTDKRQKRKKKPLNNLFI